VISGIAIRTDDFAQAPVMQAIHIPPNNISLLRELRFGFSRHPLGPALCTVEFGDGFEAVIPDSHLRPCDC
jgi:hypothetical protein